MELGFPAWVRVLHWFNFLFLSLLVRSGIEILSNHPKLYWNEHCRTGSEWLRFTKKRFSDDRMFASTDEEEPFSPIVALPGHNQLGLGRYWHFATALSWIFCGLLYVFLLVASDQWRRLIPTSPALIIDAYQAALSYAHLKAPAAGNSMDPLHPYNALQQLTYAGVVFVLAPLQIFTGIAMSPAVSNRLIWTDRIFGGRQAVRSLHFIGMVMFLGFFVGHLTMIVWHGAAHELSKMIFGRADAAEAAEAFGVAAAIIGCVVLINVAATVVSHRYGRATRRALGAVWDPVRSSLLHNLRARPTRSAAQLTPLHHMNGYPPLDIHPSAHDPTHVYERLLMNQFAEYHLEVDGLVQTPLLLSLDDLRQMRYHSTIQTHMCIQGWSGVAKWGGVQLSEIIARCAPLPAARFVAFISYQKHEKRFEQEGIEEFYYECIDLALAQHPETMLAIDMNDKPLSIRHGAPVRLRLGSTLGFKMVKYLRRIAFVDTYASLGEGQGGSREDMLHFDMGAEI